jgi:hypothetical protein
VEHTEAAFGRDEALPHDGCLRPQRPREQREKEREHHARLHDGPIDGALHGNALARDVGMRMRGSLPPSRRNAEGSCGPKRFEIVQ